jgi:hypothetical protein
MANVQPSQTKPSHAEVFALKKQRKTALAAMHRRMDVADEWLHADEDPSPILPYISKNFPPGFQWDIFPYAWTVLNRGVNQIYTSEVPQVTYELPAAYKRKYKDKEAIGKRERKVQEWLQGVLYHYATTMAENPFLDALTQQLGLGMGCLSYPLDYDRWGTPPDHGRGTDEEQEAWEQFERHRSECLPWRIDSLHPTWVLFDTHHDPPQNFIIERPVDLADMAARYPSLGLKPTEAGSGATPTATYVEYVSAEWHGEWVNGMPVTEGGDEDGIAPNGLRYAWAQIAWSGMGKKDKDGLWERRGVGMIQRGISEFRALTFDDNFVAMVKRSFIPKYVATGETAEQAADATQDIDPQSPAVVALPNTVSFAPMAPPDIPEAILTDMRERQQRLEQLYGPGLLSGEYHSEPAAKQAARMEAARGPYRAPKKAMEQAVAAMLSHFLMCVKYEPDLNEGVGVAWQAGKGSESKQYFAELKPDDVVLGGKITVDFSPLTPEDKAFKVEDARAKQEYQWISTETAMKKGGEVEDTMEEMAQIKADEVWASPEMTSFLTQLAITAIQGQLGMPPPAPPMAAGGAPGTLGTPPAPNTGMDPLPPGVPQAPPPMLGGDMAAMQAAQTTQRSVFQPPATVGGY